MLIRYPVAIPIIPLSIRTSGSLIPSDLQRARYQGVSWFITRAPVGIL